MKFVNRSGIILAESFKIGEVRAPYDELVRVFGEPERVGSSDSDDKVTKEWVIEFENGARVTIYDYKTTEWSIGGFKASHAHLVHEALAGKHILESSI